MIAALASKYTMFLQMVAFSAKGRLIAVKH
jgi:hypothetical protein